MDEFMFDFGTGLSEHSSFYFPAVALCLLFCGAWAFKLWTQKPKEILPRFTSLTQSPNYPKPAVLVDQNLTFVMNTTPPLLTLPHTRHRMATQFKEVELETV